MLQRFKYTAFHAESGKTFDRETEREMTTREFLNLINDWNRVGRGTWVYWY